MSRIAMFSTLALFVFPALMAYAAASDLLTMRIANWLVLTIAGAYFVLALIAQLPLADIGMSVGVALAVLLVAFTFFAFGWIGGGDAKLVAATTLWMGWSLEMVQYILYAGLLGGALTLMLLSVRRFPLPPPFAGTPWIDRLHDQKTGVPYGIALAAAAILVYSETPIFQRLAGF